MLVWSAHTHTLSCVPNNNKGVGKGSETGPMMDGLRVALRTLSVECCFLPESDPRPYGHQSPYRRYYGQHYIRAGAPKWVPGQERAAGQGGGGWRLRGEVLVLSQNNVLQCFVEQIIDDLGPDRVQRHFVKQDLEAPRVGV